MICLFRYTLHDGLPTPSTSQPIHQPHRIVFFLTQPRNHVSLYCSNCPYFSEKNPIKECCDSIVEPQLCHVDGDHQPQNPITPRAINLHMDPTTSNTPVKQSTMRPRALHRKATFSSRMAQLNRVADPSVDAECDAYVLQQQRYVCPPPPSCCVLCHSAHHILYDPCTELQQQCWMPLVMPLHPGGTTRKICASLLLASVRCFSYR